MSKQVPLCNDSNVQLRFLCPDDVPEVKKLCTEWFPIEYPDYWYDDITSSNRFFSLAAVYRIKIIGLVVAEIKAQSKCNKEDQGLLSSNFAKNTKVAYILTLGVVEEYRRNGIATLLLNSLVDHLTKNPDGNSCKAVYLHVLTSNTTAIQFYEKRNFSLHSYLPLYYSVHEVAKDGYSYVLYINGGHPPWTILNCPMDSVPNSLKRVFFNLSNALDGNCDHCFDSGLLQALGTAHHSFPGMYFAKEDVSPCAKLNDETMARKLEIPLNHNVSPTHNFLYNSCNISFTPILVLSLRNGII